MLSIFDNKPQIINKSFKTTSVIIAFLVAIALIPLFMPVVVCFLSEFTRTSGTAENIYYIFRGLFGVSLIVGTVTFIIKRDSSIVFLPSLISLFTVLPALYKSITELNEVRATALKLSMTMDYTLYILNIAVYAIFFFLSLFTLLYSIGLFRNNIVVMVLSVISALSVVFLCIDRYITYSASSYEILCFGYTVAVCVTPALIAQCTKPLPKKQKYIPKRSK